MGNLVICRGELVLRVENEQLNRLLTRPYTRQHQSRAGGQGQHSSWEGAVTHIGSPFSSKRLKKRSDFRRTDGPTDRHSDV